MGDTCENDKLKDEYTNLKANLVRPTPKLGNEANPKDVPTDTIVKE
jgi:hypothetical protein